tara:strand:+ start:31 stop:339 length:309 start_codon:yes stop_codon:yes gene_type:complete
MSKYAQQAKATKKKRTISQLGLAAVGKPGKTMKRRSKTMAQKTMAKKTMAQKERTLRKKKSKPLTPSEKRRMQQMKAKATTARAKASAARMDKRIAEIKKEK